MPPPFFFFGNPRLTERTLQKNVLLVRTIQNNTGNVWPLSLYFYLFINNSEYFPVHVEFLFLEILFSSRESTGGKCELLHCVFFEIMKKTLSFCFTEEAIGKSAGQGELAEIGDEFKRRLPGCCEAMGK